jgi:hypothetical protein
MFLDNSLVHHSNHRQHNKISLFIVRPQVESFTRKGIDPSKMVLDGETLREIAMSYNSYSDYGVIGLVIAGGFFLLISFALSVFSITVDNKAKDGLSEKVLEK